MPPPPSAAAPALPKTPGAPSVEPVPFLELQNVSKQYRMGEHTVSALDSVSLKIEQGDFVAIMGPSGSGKSTLMHVLGLLDVPDSGSYRVGGREVGRLREDDLSGLRREAFGFVFQQFNLLPRLTAAENVALPLLYSGEGVDLERAEEALSRVGLPDRFHHHPNELSGGQQQRAAIARALINRPRMILADEPTGNLDSASEKEILALLEELNAQGITIVVVTHEEEIGAHARRLLRMRDGKILSDERRLPAAKPAPGTAARFSAGGGLRAAGLFEYVRQGLAMLSANRVRSALSMLGILIGVGAVVAMLALGRGAQKAMEAQLATLGSNLLVLRPGSRNVGGVAQEAGATTKLTTEDAAALREKIPYVRDVAPTVNGRGQATFERRNWNTQVTGVPPSYEKMRAATPTVGRFFTEDEDRRRARVALVGLTVVRELFGGKNPVGENIKVNKVNFQVIGVLPARGGSGWRDQDDVVLVPLETAMHRILGKDYVDYIDLEIDRVENMEAAEKMIENFMLARQKVPPSQRQGAFQIRNLADIQSAITENSRTMSVLLASIAAISLLVGGIGIMNIMLVSVTERTREIGLRKAVGARRRDILAQFLAESVVVSVMGGLFGIALGWGISLLFARLAGWAVAMSPQAVALAFGFSVSIGILFGFYPAKRASLLHPIEALRHE
ncbi:MAG: ABC transporter permease [Bdellovibrionota bacterium]